MHNNVFKRALQLHQKKTQSGQIEIDNRVRNLAHFLIGSAHLRQVRQDQGKLSRGTKDFNSLGIKASQQTQKAHQVVVEAHENLVVPKVASDLPDPRAAVNEARKTITSRFIKSLEKTPSIEGLIVATYQPSNVTDKKGIPRLNPFRTTESTHKKTVLEKSLNILTLQEMAGALGIQTLPEGTTIQASSKQSTSFLGLEDDAGPGKVAMQDYRVKIKSPSGETKTMDLSELKLHKAPLNHETQPAKEKEDDSSVDTHSKDESGGYASADSKDTTTNSPRVGEPTSSQSSRSQGNSETPGIWQETVLLRASKEEQFGEAFQFEEDGPYYSLGSSGTLLKYNPTTEKYEPTGQRYNPTTEKYEPTGQRYNETTGSYESI